MKRILAVFTVLAAIVLACNGKTNNPATPSQTGASQQKPQANFSLKVLNQSWGTAIPSDFQIELMQSGKVSAFPAQASMKIALDIERGAEYKFRVLPGSDGHPWPDGYKLTASEGCQGTAQASVDCSITAEQMELACDSKLWAAVYLKSRLRVLSNCEVAVGRIEFVEMEYDGDWTAKMVVDEPYKRLLLPGNAFPQTLGRLQIEIPCQGPITQENAKGTCDGTEIRMRLPVEGQRAVAAAPWVADTWHHDWAELHGAIVKVLPR